MEILSDTLRAILVGFGFFTLLYWVSSLIMKDRISRHIAVDESATVLARYSGLVLLLLLFGHLLISQWNVHEEAIARSSSYWSSAMLFPITILFTTQMLWSKKARSSTFVRMFQATMLLIALLYGRFVIALTSYHRDFMPGPHDPLGKFILQVLLSFALFAFTLVITHWIRKRGQRSQ